MGRIRFSHVLLIGCLISVWNTSHGGLVFASQQKGNQAGPAVTADSAILMDAQTGQILYEKRAHERRHPASTTKIMTAILALEMGGVGQEVLVSRNAALTPGSSMNLRAGEKYRLKDLLTGLMMVSGNDAAEAIAEHFAGTAGDFGVLMTARAREMGLRNTRFRNPHGLTEPNHFSSAYDLAMMARHALEKGEFARLVCTQEATVCGNDPAGKAINKELHNTNYLLFSYQWADGVKTGTTSAAGKCLVSSATRYGQQLIAVVLHSDDRWGDSQRLLEYGFKNFSLRNFAPAGETVRYLPVEGGLQDTVPLAPVRDLKLVVRNADLKTVKTVVNTVPTVTAPVPAGTIVGSLTVTRGTEVFGRVPLVTTVEVPKAPFWRRHPLRGLFR